MASATCRRSFLTASGPPPRLPGCLSGPQTDGASPHVGAIVAVAREAVRAPQNCHAARTRGCTPAGAARCQVGASLRRSRPDMRDLLVSFDSFSTRWAFASRNHSKKTITRPTPRRAELCTRIAGTLQTAHPQSASQITAAAILSHACTRARLPAAPRPARRHSGAVRWAGPAGILHALTQHPAARPCCTPAPPPPPADATRLSPGSAQGVGIAVLGAAAVLPRRQQRRGGTSLLWPRPRPSAGEPPSSSRVGDPSTPASALILP